MLTLAAGETISAVAAAATTITYTITGMELNAGVEAYKVLAQGQLPASAGVLYTAPASTQAFVKSLHLANTSGADVTGIKLFKNGTGAINQLTGSMTIPVNGWASYEEDGWRVYNASGERLMNGVTASGGGGSASAHDISSLYEFDVTTTDSDPGVGKFRTANLMSPPGTPSGTQTVTIFISTTDKNGKDMSSFFDNWTPDNFLNAYVSMYNTSIGVNSLSGRMMARITGIVSAVGYRKVSLRFVQRPSTNPFTNAQNFQLYWAFARKNAPIPPLSATGTFNNSSNFGIPGFIPLRSKAKNLTTMRVYMAPFTIREPIVSKGLRAIVSTAASSGQWRGYLMPAMNMGSDGMMGWGAALGDTGALSHINATGAKNMPWTAGNVMLAPGHYMLALALNSFGGTLQVASLMGVWADRGIIQFPSGATWQIAQEYGYSNGADWTTTSFANQLTEMMGFNFITLSTSSVTDQFEVPFLMEWEAV